MSVTFNVGDRVEGTCAKQPPGRDSWYAVLDHQPGFLRTHTPIRWLRLIDSEEDYKDDVTG